MTTHIFQSCLALLCAVPLLAPFARAQTGPADRPLRIIAFGAHPDDCEFRMGGAAIKWVQAGQQGEVRFGDERRHRSLALRRRSACPTPPRRGEGGGTSERN